MIFSGERNGISHIEMIRNGTKTQTRRINGFYEVGKTYAVQPGRGKKAVSDIRIRITKRWESIRAYMISEDHAKAEGGYTPTEYEELFAKMYPNWWIRWAYVLVRQPKQHIHHSKI